VQRSHSIDGKVISFISFHGPLCKAKSKGLFHAQRTWCDGDCRARALGHEGAQDGESPSLVSLPPVTENPSRLDEEIVERTSTGRSGDGWEIALTCIDRGSVI
jgi:hypothetical protein